MMSKLAAFLGCLLLAATPAVAAESADTKPKKEKLVCKRVEGTGWRLSNSNKVCKTAKEWAEISDTNQKEFREYNRSGSSGTYGDGVLGRETGN